MASTIEEFLLKFKTIGADSIKSATDGMKKLNDEGSKFNANGIQMGNVAAGLAGKMGTLGTGVLAVGTAFVAAGLKAINLADQFGDISDATGISSSALMDFKQSLILAGGKSEDFAQLATKLSQNIGDAALGSDKAQKAFKTLGVYVTDASGKIRDTGDILRDAIAALAGIEDPAKRASLAVDIFGKGANKLDFTKLSAVNDPFKDAEIAQLNKYKDALDSMANAAETRLITVFGKLALMIKDSQDAATKADEDAARRGNKRIAVGRTAAMIEVPMTAEEQAAYQKKQYEAEQAKLMASYRPRYQEAGGFGALTPAQIESNKKIAVSNIEISRYAELKAQDARTALALKGANERQAIDIKANNDIKNIEIQTSSDIQKLTAEIRANDKLDALQQNAEIAVKTKELQSKAALEIQKIREKAAKDAADYQYRLNAKVYAEEETERQAAAEAFSKQKDAMTAASVAAGELIKQIQLGNDLDRDKFDLEQRLVGVSAIEAETQRKIFDLEQKRKDGLRQIAAIPNITGADRTQRERELNDEIDRGIIIAKTQGEVTRKNQEDFMFGWSTAFNKYADDAKNAADEARTYFETFSRGIEDAFVNLARTGKLTFKDLIDNLIAEMIRFQIKSAVSGLGMIFKSFFGNGVQGGIPAGMSPETLALIGLAGGGPTNANSPYIVGENGPELFIPKTAGNIVPNNQMSAAGFGQTVVNYNIQAVDAVSFKALVARDPSFLFAVTEKGRRNQPQRRLA